MRRKSLFWKMTGSTLCIVAAAFVILMGYTYQINVGILKSNAIQNNQKNLGLISEKIDDYLNMLELVSAFTYENDLQMLLIRTDAETDISAMRRLRNFQNFYYRRLVSLEYDRQIQDIYFIYPDGEVLHKGNGILDQNCDMTGYDWYEEAVRAGGRTIVVDTHKQEYHRPLRYPEYGETDYYISVARSVNSRYDNSLIGVLMMDIELSELTEMIGPLLLGEESMVYFTDSDGTILYSSDLLGIGERLPADLARGYAGKPEGSLEQSIDGVENIVTWRMSAKTGWYLISVNYTDVVITEAEKMKFNMVLLGIAVFAMTAGIMAVYAKRVLDPVRKLSVAMRQVETGDLDVSVEPSSDDETGQMTKNFNHMVSRLRGLIRDNYLIRIKEKDAQIESLQLQINPHFLYNTLESMNCIAMVNEVEEISVISKALARMFRYSIRSAGTFVPVSEELEHVQNYMEIQRVRFGKKVRMSCEVEEETKKLRIIPFVLQPLVENSIRYNVEDAGRAVRIRIVITRQGERLTFAVWDDGIGIETDRLAQLKEMLERPEQLSEKGKHIGLRNVNDRLKLHYGPDAGLKPDSQAGSYTCITFELPVEAGKK